MKEWTPEERRKWLDSLFSLPAGAVVLVENSEGSMLVVKARYRNYWTPPGGVIDEDESPKQAAIREVREEVGLELAPEMVKFLAVQYRIRDTYLFVFGASIDNMIAEKIVLQESEIESYAFVTKEQVVQDRKSYSPPVVAWATSTLEEYAEVVRLPA